MKHILNKELSINDVVALTILNESIFYESQSPDNIALLAKTAKRLPSGSVYLEIGTRSGMSMLAVALANPNIELYGVDKDPRCEYFVHKKIDGINEVLTKFHVSGGQDWKLRERIHILKGLSQEFDKTWEKPIDFLFIDGDHTGKGVARDILSWSKFVKLNGFMGFHDYADEGAMMDGKPDRVTAVVNNMIIKYPAKWYLEEAHFHMAIFRKLYEEHSD